MANIVSITQEVIDGLKAKGIDAVQEIKDAFAKMALDNNFKGGEVQIVPSVETPAPVEKRPKYVSTKTYGAERGFAVAYRQWRADSHCNLIHGYAMGFHFEFESEELDVRNWVVDFGSLKSLKEKLDEWFDHTCLVAQDDPEFAMFEEMHKRNLIKMVVVERTGCEGLATFLAEYINEIWMEENGYAGRVKLRKVEVRETPSNSAMWLAE